jgi:hypothetical protein
MWRLKVYSSNTTSFQKIFDTFIVSFVNKSKQ